MLLTYSRLWQSGIRQLKSRLVIALIRPAYVQGVPSYGKSVWHRSCSDRWGRLVTSPSPYSPSDMGIEWSAARFAMPLRFGRWNWQAPEYHADNRLLVCRYWRV